MEANVISREMILNITEGEPCGGVGEAKGRKKKVKLR
jgi:hypothetical protein